MSFKNSITCITTLQSSLQATQWLKEMYYYITREKNIHSYTYIYLYILYVIPTSVSSATPDNENSAAQNSMVFRDWRKPTYIYNCGRPAPRKPVQYYTNQDFSTLANNRYYIYLKCWSTLNTSLQQSCSFSLLSIYKVNGFLWTQCSKNGTGNAQRTHIQNREIVITLSLCFSNRTVSLKMGPNWVFPSHKRADSWSVCPTPVYICTHMKDHVRILKIL